MEQSSEVRVVPLDQTMLTEASMVVAKAFATEAITRSQMDLSSDTARIRAARLMRLRLRLYLEGRQPLLAALVDGRVAGVAMVTMSGFDLPLGLALRIALPSLPGLVPLALYQRGNPLHQLRAGAKPKDLPPCYYSIEMLAVEPSFQGRRIGGRLLGAIAALAEGDPQAAGVYLATGEERTSALYAQHGYELLETRHAGDLCVYHMFRSKESQGVARAVPSPAA